MLALQDYLVLNYLEWLKDRANIDELFLNEENNQELIRLTKKYIEKNNNKFGNIDTDSTDKLLESIIINSFKDMFFSDGKLKDTYLYHKLKHCVKHCNNDQINRELNDLKDDIRFHINDLIHSIYRNKELNEKALNIFKTNIHLATQLRDMTYYSLIDSAKYYMYDNYNRKDSDNNLSEIAYYSDINIIEDFFSYLESKDIKIKLTKAPDTIIDNHIDLFLESKCYTQYTKLSKRKINNIKLKLKNNHTVIEKMLRKVICVDNKIDNYKDLGYLYKRSINNNIYKCLILPTKAKTKLEEFYSTYWHDLDALSDDYLDIYYSISQINDSGHQIANSLFKGQAFNKKNLPCLIIWKENIKIYEAIYIGDIIHNQIFKVFQHIVEEISNNSNLSKIKKTTDNFINEMKEESKQNTIIKIDKNYGIAGVNISDFTINFNLSHDLNKAIIEIENLDNDDNEFISRASSIMKRTQSAIANNSDTQIQECKSKFKKHILNAGEKAAKVIEILSGFATIAGFFGLNML